MTRVTDDALSPAAALVRVPGAALSHEEAARQLGLPLAQDDGTRRLTVGRNRSRLVVPGWQVRRADLSDDDLVLTRDGLRVTSVARTLVDLSRVLPTAHAVATADAALRTRAVKEGVLRAALVAARGTGSARARTVQSLTDPQAGSVLESLLRVQLHDAGFPAPCTQYEVRAAGRFVARVDFCWPAARLVVEADGFAFHSDRASYRKDRQRMNQLESLGWRVLRFTWEDVVGRPEYIVALVAACLPKAA